MLDARKLSEETLQKLKHQSHQLRLQGYAWSEVSRTLGLSLSTVLRWAKRYQLGEDCFHERRNLVRNLDSVSRTKRSLSHQEEKSVLEVLATHTPESMKHAELQGKLWNRRRVQQMIRLKVGVFLPTRTVSHYLMRWGISGQRPLTENEQSDETGFHARLCQDYPDVAESVRASHSIAYWFQSDELTTQSALLETTSDTGEVKKMMPKQFFSAIDSRGVLHFRLYGDCHKEEYTAYQFAKDLECDTQKPVCLMCSELFHVLFKMDPRSERDKLQVIAIPYLNTAIFQPDQSSPNKPLASFLNTSLYSPTLNS